MATAVQFQPRPSMDRAASFDQPGSSSTPPFATQLPFNPRSQHSRTSSSSSSPYAQPFAGNYFQGYQPPPPNNYQGQYPPGFHQQAEFAAWANAYHQMMATYQPDGRQRTSSGPSAAPTVSYAQAVSNSKPVVSSRRSNPPNPVAPIVRPRPSQEVTRSASNPSLGAQDHRRSSSNDSRPTARVTRQTSFDKPVRPVVSRSASPASNKNSPSPTGSGPARRPSQPLYPGPIANATNQIIPSPLSQTITEPEKKGFASRFKKNADTTPKRQTVVVKPSPSDTSTRSGTPPVTPPQDLSPPAAPFAVQHPASLGSEVSIAETERTATASKGKKSLFRMKNMSTDNISLSSTVSSASMMIRKMGSLGRLARRNSLMGISRIFKDKPKDEDAALPEREGKGKKKKKGKKAAALPPVVSPATVEASKEEEEDRTLVGLSPAAKLARQHTLRSRAEQAKRESTGEPAWDNNTATRNTQPQGNPQVVHIQPSRMSTVVHAVNVADHEYDSDDDSSDGETLEDITEQMSKVRLSDDADREFRETWASTYIDRNAVPKKGILKSIASSEHLGATEDLRYDPFSPTFAPFDADDSQIYSSPTHNTSAPTLVLPKPTPTRANTAPIQRRLEWATSCSVYSTYDALTYDRRSEPATCNRLTPDLAMAIKQELNAFKLEMPVHPLSRVHTHYFA